VKRIIKGLLRVTETGDRLYEEVEVTVDNEDGTINTAKREILPTCQNCGQPVEKVRSSCPLCEGFCCDFCHEQRLRHEKLTFERMIIVERERLRWLESGMFDGFPGIKLYRRIAGFNSMSRLKSMQRRLLQR
jgi:hypothetical protein